jgi:hypothetical protein
MMISRTSARKVVALAGLGLVTVLGCGDDTGLARRYPVSGTVTYKGDPVEKGRIDFKPTQAEGRDASGEIVDGKYSLTTAVSDDSALPGPYKVTVTSVEVDTTALKAIAKGGLFHHDKTFAKAVRNAKRLVPSRYQLANTSGLTATVKAESNTSDFHLKD